MTPRPLTPDDLDAVVALDTQTSGRSRRGYFEKRLAAALREPEAHIQVAIDKDGLAGFALARVLEGEFGGRERSALLEAMGVAPRRQGRGVGQALLAGLEEVMRHKGIPVLRTEAAWNDHAMLRFLDNTGFALAPRQVIERPIDAGTEL